MATATELIKKLKALAENGIGGEKKNAKSLLEKYLQKYGISDDQLAEDELQVREFKFNGEREKRLLYQIIYKVTNSRDNFYSFFIHDKKRRNVIGSECSKAQEIEIHFLFDFYKRLYEKEEVALYSAFIQKHKLFGSSPSDSTNTISDEEWFQLEKMMSALSNESPLLLIKE